MAERHGVDTLDLTDDVPARLRDATDGRGPHSVVDAVGMEAHGNAGSIVHAVRRRRSCPTLSPRPLMKTTGVDRLAALHLAIDAVRRGGTVSLSGVYAGAADPMPLVTMFDKQLALRMGQCNVHSWRDDLLPLVEDPADPLGVEDLITHRIGLDRAPELYDTFHKKEDGCIKVVIQP